MNPNHLAAPGWDTGWMRDASCAQIPGLPWTDSDSDTIPPLLVDLMAATCGACPVVAECGEFVDQAEVTAGWWAGESRNDRQPWNYYLHSSPAPDVAPSVDPAIDPDAA